MHYKSTSLDTLEIGLINVCNLRCPLCLRSSGILKDLKKGEKLDLSVLINFLDGLTSLSRVVLMGSVSEPTLYPELFSLIEYLKKRNIRIRLSTNANTHTVDYWRSLSELLDENDIVRFAVDGSTQELHEKYRVGGSLEVVLNNHRAFKEKAKAATVLQNIIFEYNVNDKENIKDIFLREGFTYLEFSPCYEPPNFKDTAKDKILPVPELVRYQKTKNSVNDRIVSSCPEFKSNAAYLGHRGILVPCNEQEDRYMREKNPITIYNSTLESCFDHMNKILDNIKNDSICQKSCSLMGQLECVKHPIVQLDRDFNSFDLIDFREKMPANYKGNSSAK